MDRRNFLKTSGLALLGSSIFSQPSEPKVEYPNKADEKTEWVFHEMRTPRETEKIYKQVVAMVDNTLSEFYRPARQNQRA